MGFQINHWTIQTVNSINWFCTPPLWALQQWFPFACSVFLSLFFLVLDCHWSFFPLPTVIPITFPVSYTSLYLINNTSLKPHNSKWEGFTSNLLSFKKRQPPEYASNMYGIVQHYSVMRQHVSLLQIEIQGCLRSDCSDRY